MLCVKLGGTADWATLWIVNCLTIAVLRWKCCRPPENSSRLFGVSCVTVSLSSCVRLCRMLKLLVCPEPEKAGGLMKTRLQWL